MTDREPGHRRDWLRTGLLLLLAAAVLVPVYLVTRNPRDASTPLAEREQAPAEGTVNGGGSGEASPVPPTGAPKPGGAFASEPREVQANLVYLAIRDRDLDGLRELLDGGVSPNVENWAGVRPLRTAIESGFFDGARLLLDRGAEFAGLYPNLPDAKACALQALRGALSTGYRDPTATAAFAEKLISDLGLDLGGPERMVFAVFRGDAAEIQRLIKSGIDSSARTTAGTLRGTTPLEQATAMRRHDLVDVLIAGGALRNNVRSADRARYRPLQSAAARGDLAEVARRLTNGEPADGDLTETPYGSTSATPLYYAAKEGRVKVIHFLLSNGADPNVRLFPQGSALVGAVRGGSEEAVRELLENDADPNLAVLHGPLTTAVMRGNAGMVQLLLDHGAKLELRTQVTTNIRGKRETTKATPLAHAARLGHTAVVEILLRAGADVNADLPGVGIKPVEWALYMAHSKVLEVLLIAGADTEVLRGKGPEGKTTLEIVRARGYREVEIVLVRQHLLAKADPR